MKLPVKIHVDELRRGTEAEWLKANPVLEHRELGFVTDKNQLVVGDGQVMFTYLRRVQL